MQTAAINDDIRSLNISYLMCLREMARIDPVEAGVRFGVDRTMASRLAETPVERITKIASPSILQFTMRADNQVRALLNGDESAPLRNVMSMLGEAANDAEYDG